MLTSVKKIKVVSLPEKEKGIGSIFKFSEKPELSNNKRSETLDLCVCLCVCLYMHIYVCQTHCSFSESQIFRSLISIGATQNLDKMYS